MDQHSSSKISSENKRDTEEMTILQ
ncbi:hypothetical protein A2U01_0087373, partial [Trifolium medium]|nr:hypothetical protein [Trifolium medium]